MHKADILIIGAGAVGTALAREFSKFKVKVIVCDKNDDVGGDASAGNDEEVLVVFGGEDPLEAEIGQRIEKYHVIFHSL